MSSSATRFASLLATFACGAALALGGAGCILAGPNDKNGQSSTSTPDPTPADPNAVADVTVDADATLTLDPGNGVGLFVEYQSGGHWSLLTTCDTLVSKRACAFDVAINALDGGMFGNVQAQNPGPNDSVSVAGHSSIQMSTDTSLEASGATFDATPGATIRVEAHLDGADARQFVFAVSGGKVVKGVLTNPVTFTPSAP
jgi:hypothetical protein